MEVSIKNKLGSIGTFYDPKTSTRERAIIMRKNLANEDLLIPARVTNAEVATALLNSTKWHLRSALTSESAIGFMLEKWDDGRLHLGLPSKQIHKYTRVSEINPILKP